MWKCFLEQATNLTVDRIHAFRDRYFALDLHGDRIVRIGLILYPQIRAVVMSLGILWVKLGSLRIKQ